MTKTYDMVRALDNINLKVQLGTVHGVVGQNGAGKTTLMSSLGGAVIPDSGQIWLNGAEVAIRNPDHARRLGIRTLHQELNLVPYQTVAENIFLGIEPRRGVLADRGTMRRRARELLAQLGSDVSIDAKVETLNIGQQQLVEIAKALAWEAAILILDEPTAALESREMERLFDVIRRFREHGGTALYVSHRLNELFAICDCVTVLRDGKLIKTVGIRDVTSDAVIAMMIGRDLGEVFPTRAVGDDGDVALEARNLSTKVLKSVDLVCRSGRILGVVGLEGSGIRELGRALIGDEPRTTGNVYVGDRRVDLNSPRHGIDAGIAYLSSDRKRDGLFQILSVSHNIAMGSLVRFGRFNALLDFRAERRLVRESVGRLGIQTPSAKQEVRFLSGGNQQKVLLARWLTKSPRVFILDEPTRGIDVGSKAEIYAFMRELAEAGAAVVMISTDITEIVGMSDEVIVFHSGEITARLGAATSEDDVMSHVTGVATNEDTTNGRRQS